MRKLIVVLAAVSVTAGGAALTLPAAAASATSSAAASSSARITWGKCSDPDLKKANAQCGFLKVPLDYRHPKGAKISLAVSRIKHTSPASQYQGVILTNPGGPGGSGRRASTRSTRR